MKNENLFLYIFLFCILILLVALILKISKRGQINLDPFIARLLTPISKFIPGNIKALSWIGISLFGVSLVLPAYKTNMLGQNNTYFGYNLFLTGWISLLGFQLQLFFTWLGNMPALLGLFSGIQSKNPKGNGTFFILIGISVVLAWIFALDTLDLPRDEGTATKIPWNPTYGAYVWFGFLLVSFLIQIKLLGADRKTKQLP